MDAFGKITSAVARTLRHNRENPFKLPETMSPGSQSSEPEEEVNRCFCGQGKLDRFMLDCDRCHGWYHGSCIGVTKDSVPDSWICDDCTLQTTIMDQAKVFARANSGSGVLTSKDHNHVLRQFLLSYLSRIAQTSSSPQQADIAREFLIALWVKDLTMEKNKQSGTFDLELVRSHAIAQWSPPNNKQHNSRSKLLLTGDGNQRIMSSLVASSELSTSFTRLLGVLLRLMADNMASLRKLSLKTFLQVVNVDPALMTQPFTLFRTLRGIGTLFGVFHFE